MSRRHCTTLRPGFTLIELLVVMAIIVVLMALLLPAIGTVRVRAKVGTAVADASQVGNAIAAFKAKTNIGYIPAGRPGPVAGPFRLRQQYAGNEPELVYLKQIFPQLPYLVGPVNPATPQYDPAGTGLPDLDLDANQTLVFFLTGGPVTSYQGFSTDPRHPFTLSANSQTIGPFLDVNANKVDGDGRLLDPWGTPYAYFTHNPSRGVGNYEGAFVWNTVTVLPYHQNGKYLNAKSFQLISAGPNEVFGVCPAPPDVGWTPGTGTWTETGIGGDDVARFAGGQLVQAP